MCLPTTRLSCVYHRSLIDLSQQVENVSSYDTSCSNRYRGCLYARRNRQKMCLPTTHNYTNPTFSTSWVVAIGRKCVFLRHWCYNDRAVSGCWGYNRQKMCLPTTQGIRAFEKSNFTSRNRQKMCLPTTHVAVYPDQRLVHLSQQMENVSFYDTLCRAELPGIFYHRHQ